MHGRIPVLLALWWLVGWTNPIHAVPLVGTKMARYRYLAKGDNFFEIDKIQNASSVCLYEIT